MTQQFKTWQALLQAQEERTQAVDALITAQQSYTLTAVPSEAQYAAVRHALDDVTRANEAICVYTYRLQSTIWRQHFDSFAPFAAD